MIPQSIIDEILSRVDIVEIISPRVQLSKKGKYYSALCPFHAEKTPSFNVYPLKQFYYCFGCQAGGNGISFLMAYDRMSFLEAIETLAKLVGVELLQPSMEKTAKASQESFDVLQQSACLYQNMLSQDIKAQKYLHSRGLNQEIIERFHIGFAPPSWDFIKKSLGKNPRLIETLLQMGMLVTKSNKYFDRFRNRIMFPIRNYKGQIIAFGGRSLDKELPKYLNSPETSIFHKSQELYGLYEVLQTNNKISRLLIVEGYLDVVTLHQHGIQYCVATLGTSTSIHHLHRLFRYTNDIVFCFDGDRAGSIAAWRALLTTLPVMRDGLNVSFLFLPKGEDPDSLIRKIGKSNFAAKIDQALPLADFFFMRLQNACDITKINGKAKLAHLAESLLEKMPLGIFRELMYERLANLIGVDADKISQVHASHQSIPRKKADSVGKAHQLIPPVRLALSLLLQDPKLLTNITIPKAIFHVKLIGLPTLLRLIEIIRENPQQNTGSLLEYCNNQSQKEILVELAAINHVIPTSHWKDELQGALVRIVEIAQEQEIQTLFLKGNRGELSKEEKTHLQLLLTQRNSSKT